MRVPIALATLIAALGGLAAPAAGQGGVKGMAKTFGNDMKNAVLDIGRIYAAPIHTDADDLPAIAIFTGTALALAAVDGPVERWILDHDKTVALKWTEPFREGNYGLQFGDASDLMRWSGVAYVVGLVSGSQGIREAGLGCATALQANSWFRHFLYKNVSRDRPIVDGVRNDDPYRFKLGEGGWDRHSFFGGHGANAVTCATFLNKRFDWGLAEPVIYAAALGVAVGRSVDGRHWPSDTFIGIAFGYALGELVAHRMKERDRKADERERAAPAPPPSLINLSGVYLGKDGRTMYLGYKHTF